MNRLIRLLKGYVQIRLISREPERFLNLCARSGILLWQVASRDGFYEMYLSVADFFRLRLICRKSGSTIKILGKYGFSFYLYRNRKRKVFFAGGILFCSIVLLLSLFVWNIHVTGNYANSTGTILEFLKSKGIMHGILKSKIRCGEIASMLREEFPNITWVSAKLEGTQLILEIKENVDGYVGEETLTEPSDLVASRDGTVVSIITRAGTPLVLPGSPCKKGDILVSGEIPVRNDSQEVTGYRYVPADADILLSTVWYYYDEFPLEYEKKYYQEEESVYPVFQIGNFRFESFWPFRKQQTADEETHLTQLRLTENFLLPISVGYRKIMPYITEQKKHTEEEAKEISDKHLMQYRKNLEEEQVAIQDIDVTVEIIGDICRTKGNVTVLESAFERQPCVQKNTPSSVSTENQQTENE